MEGIPIYSIIIPVYNGIRYTQECIESIEKYSAFGTAELIVIDNASIDETPSFLQNQRNCIVITNTVNRGFASAVNQGLRRARGEYLVIVNNDIVITSGWLEHFAETIESNGAYGILGPVTNYISGPQMLQAVPYSSIPEMHTFARRRWEQFGAKIEQADTLRGFCMFIKRDVIEAIGGFDERFKIGNYEDDDFCLRAQQKGFSCGVAVGIFIHHYGSATFKTLKKDYGEILQENAQKFAEKWNIQPAERREPISEMVDNSNSILSWESIPSGKELCKNLLDEGNALAAQGQFEAGLEKYRTILKTHPNHLEALHNLNAVLFQMGKRSEALTGFQSIIRIDPTFPEVHCTLGAIAEASSDYKSALNHFRDCIARDIHHEKAYNGYARSAEKSGLKHAGQMVDFVFYTSGIPFDGNTIKKRGLGGSESALFYIARCLAHNGYSVKVFNKCEQPGVYDGVEYRELVDFYLFNHWNSASVFISSRSFKPVFYPVNAKTKVVWLHDMPDVAYLGDYDLSKADLSDYTFFTLSTYQTEQWKSFLGIEGKQFYITRNGFDPAWFSFYIVTRKRNKLIYSSRPNRGLDVLLNVFPEIRKQVPDVELHVFTYALSEGDREYEPYLRKLHQPGIIFRGSVSQDVLAREMMEARLLVYPSTFKETSCITAIEAQAAGTPVVTSNRGALPETVTDSMSGIVINGDPYSLEYQERFVNEVVRLIQDDKLWKKLSDGARKRAYELYTWEHIAQEWLEYFTGRGVLKNSLQTNGKGDDCLSFPPRVLGDLSLTNQSFNDLPKEQSDTPLQSVKTPKLSLCMIVKNEEKTLPVCLESVKAIIDEIIIIDTGSTDKTVEIAQLYGAKVYSFGWIDDFSAARNESLRYASGDWILYLDADERVTPENAAKIRGVIKNPDITAVNIIEHIPQEKGNLFKTTASDYCRLFRNDPRIRFSGRVHEQILPAVNAIGGNVLKSSIRIDHWGYAVSETKRTERARRNLSLLLKDVGDNPDDPFVWFNIGLAYKTLGNTEEAINALTKAVELPDDTMKHTIRSSAYTALAQLCFARDNLESAENYALQALTLEKSNLLAQYILAGTAFQKEHYKEAETTLRTIATLAEAGALSVEINRAQLYFDIGNCLFKLQQYSEAANVYKKAAALDLNLFEVYFNTGICMMKLHNPVEAREYFKRASELQPDNDSVIQLLEEIEQILKP